VHPSHELAWARPSPIATSVHWGSAAVDGDPLVWVAEAEMGIALLLSFDVQAEAARAIIQNATHA